MPDERTVMEAIRRHTTVVVPEVEPESVTPDRTLAELGCNSIDRAEIISLVMADLGIAVPLSEFRQGSDVAMLVDVLRRHA